jgi:hypothetical protein
MPACPIGMVLANPADAEANGTVPIHGSWGCFCLKLPATLSQPDDRIPRPCRGAHRPAAKADTRVGQYQFERAYPLGAFSEITDGPIRPVWGGGRMEPWWPCFQTWPNGPIRSSEGVPAKISAPSRILLQDLQLREIPVRLGARTFRFNSISGTASASNRSSSAYDRRVSILPSISADGMNFPRSASTAMICCSPS